MLLAAWAGGSSNRTSVLAAEAGSDVWVTADDSAGALVVGSPPVLTGAEVWLGLRLGLAAGGCSGSFVTTTVQRSLVAASVLSLAVLMSSESAAVPWVSAEPGKEAGGSAGTAPGP